MENLLGPVIGSGGFGIVYENNNDRSTCIKVSNRIGSCRKWSDEYNTILMLMENIEKHPYYNNFELVKILKPTQFIEVQNLCYMFMPRVYRPNRDDGPTFQALIGANTRYFIHPERGHFIGRAEILEYISYPNLRKACYELGVMMALIHFVGKNDAYDTEVYLGKEVHSENCRFYIGDFDRSKIIDNYDDETLDRMAWSFLSVEYFPTENNEILSGVFKSGYSVIAANYFTREEVDKLFSQYPV